MVNPKTHSTKADLAVRRVLRTLAVTPGLSVFIGVGSETFDKLIEAAAEADGFALNNSADYIAYWNRIVDGVNFGIL